MQYRTNYPYATTSQQYGATTHQRDEQRRRQQEYSRALAQQVAQREQQKRRERELDHQYGRNYGNFQNQPASEQSRPEALVPVESGMFKGLGCDNQQNSRTSFARGQPQLHHRLPEAVNYPQTTGFPPTGVSYSGHVQHQQPVENQSFASGFKSSDQQQQNWQQQPAQDPVGLGSNMQSGWPLQQNSQVRSSQFWPGQPIVEQSAPAFGVYASPQRAAQPNLQPGFPQTEPIQNGGRRQRTDIHNGGRDNSGEVENFRRKVQQQQEMQLALERQIQEKRQQKLEAKRRQEEEDRREMERFEEEKRRQRAEEERIQEEKRRKAEIEQQRAQQAAAAVAAANQQAKLQQQQKLHAQVNQVQHLQYLQHDQSFHQQPHQQPSSELKNPFTNSRAHLFDDPPAPRDPSNHFGYLTQHSSPLREKPPDFGHVFPQENNHVGHPLDPIELRRQYDDMRNELRLQKQLVDQLRQAQVQIQQQQLSPTRVKSGTVPTLMDLEKLRNELRGELVYREQLHRQELESLKREHQHDRSPTRSPHKLRQSPIKPEGQPQSIDRLSATPLDASLRGESKFVYFDGRVAKSAKIVDEAVKRSKDQSELYKPTRSEVRRSINSPVKLHGVIRSVVSMPSPFSTKNKTSVRDVGTEIVDESQDFFVTGISSSPLHHQLISPPTSPSNRSGASSHRYSHNPSVFISSSPLKKSVKWRLKSMDTDDSDDDLDVSLDGEQLEALFQRNVRRHEILVGFQTKIQAQVPDSNQLEIPGKMAWTELCQQLESNRLPAERAHRRRPSTTSTDFNDSYLDQQHDTGEEALVASSKWMAS